MDQFFYWSGVVLWAASCLFVLMAIAQWLGMNIPSIERGNGWTIYKLGVGDVVIITDEESVGRMRRCGFYVHDAKGYWWSGKIFRIML